MPAKKDLTGQQFGKWAVLKRVGNLGNGTMYLCKCQCGKECLVAGGSLTSKKSTGCIGCGRLKHGHTRAGNVSPEYKAWSDMIKRCTHPNMSNYHRYGGRGITVCKSWKTDFLVFLTDMGNRPDNTYSLDRINVDGNYEPDNCRWATVDQQNNNKRSNRFITYNGTKQTITQWASQLGLSWSALDERLKRWPLELAMETPNLRKNPKHRQLMLGV